MRKGVEEGSRKTVGERETARQIAVCALCEDVGGMCMRAPATDGESDGGETAWSERDEQKQGDETARSMREPRKRRAPLRRRCRQVRREGGDGNRDGDETSLLRGSEREGGAEIGKGRRVGWG